MLPVVRLGDTSDHGGVMITATGEYTANDIEGCVHQDLHSCPLPGHGVTPVTATAINGASDKAFLRIGDIAGCGAVLVTGDPTVTSI